MRDAFHHATAHLAAAAPHLTPSYCMLAIELLVGAILIAACLGRRACEPLFYLDDVGGLYCGDPRHAVDEPFDN